jgi:hypothetical protein
MGRGGIFLSDRWIRANLDEHLAEVLAFERAMNAFGAFWIPVKIVSLHLIFPSAIHWPPLSFKNCDRLSRWSETINPRTVASSSSHKISCAAGFRLDRIVQGNHAAHDYAPKGVHVLQGRFEMLAADVFK